MFTTQERTVAAVGLGHSNEEILRHAYSSVRTPLGGPGGAILDTVLGVFAVILAGMMLIALGTINLATRLGNLDLGNEVRRLEGHPVERRGPGNEPQPGRPPLPTLEDLEEEIERGTREREPEPESALEGSSSGGVRRRGAER